MTNTTHLTQCPACQHAFNITDEQLGLKSGYARCGNCHKIFSAIDHIIPASQESSEITSAPAVATPTEPTNDLELLFDDHSGLDEDGGIVTSPAHSNRVAKNNKNSASQANSTDFEIIDNFDTLPSAVTGDFSEHANAQKDTQDEAWLNDLLEEDNKKYQQHVVDNKLTTINRQNNDVTNLLDDLGVGVKYETAPSNDEYMQKLEQRMAGQVSTQRRQPSGSMGMNLVWLLGSLLLAAALYLQYLVFNMNELVKDPSKASQVATLCSMVGCHPPLANEQAINVNTLTINPTKGDANKTDLVLTVKNTTQEMVLYPNLKFTLRQGNETKSQFVLTPSQYVDANTTSMVAGEIRPVKLRIDYPRDKFEQANIDVFY